MLCVPNDVGYNPLIIALLAGAQTGTGEYALLYTTPSFAKLER